MFRLTLTTVFAGLWLFVSAQEPSASKTILIKTKTDLSQQPTGSNIRSIRPILTEKSKFLDGVFVLKIDESADSEQILDSLRKQQTILYAEPVNQESLLAVPNDPLAAVGGGQSHLQVIKAYQAWDISQGSEQIVIGISDTGVDFNHDDIKGNLFQNPDELANGLDDDGNGYVDDLFGYDFADLDANAQVGANVHGNQVAGIAGASTNNGIGIAGVGYKSKISPLKMFTSETTSSVGAYESILYAANEGYDIVNLSWGSVNTFSQAAQDIINYAVLEKNVVLVAAAGNTNALLDYYPASYDHVLSVGWTNLDDSKANNGTYSYNIDLMAPGTAILSTFKNNGYYADVGSSFAAPQVAGTAALVKAHYPNLNALQIMEVIRTTTDDIYSLSANAPYIGQLGSGRLNAYKALTQDTLRSVRAESVNFFTSRGSMAYFGDTVHLALTLQNFLYPIQNGIIKFSSDSPYTQFITTIRSFGFTDSLGSQYHSLPLLILAENTPADQTIRIRLDYSSGLYRDFQYIEFKTAPDYVILGDSLSLLVGGNGDLGISKGINHGFQKDQEKLTRNLGVMFGNSKSYLKDNVINNLIGLTVEPNFENSLPIKQINYNLADGFAESSFTSMDGTFRVEQSIYQSDTKVLLLRYRMINVSGDTLRNLQAGLFADWLIQNNTKNRAFYSIDGAFAYSYDSDSTFFAGMKAYGEAMPIVQSIDLNSFNENTRDIGDAITDSIKYTWLNQARYDSAGKAGIGNDVAQSLAVQPFNLPNNSAHEVIFMLGAADSYDQLKVVFERGKAFAAELLQNPVLLEQFTSCAGASLILDPKKDSLYRFYSDPLGQNLIGSGSTLSTGVLTTDTSFYAQSADQAYLGPIRKIAIKMVENVADFIASSDTLYLDHPTVNRVSFTDRSFNATSWQWDFGNGTRSTVQNPSVNFTKAGNLTVYLAVVNALGCEDTQTRKLVVANRPAMPDLQDVVVCAGASTILQSGSDTLRVYDSHSAHAPIFQGQTFQAKEIQLPVTYYVSAIKNGFESLRKRVVIAPDSVQATIEYRQNTSSESPEIILFTPYTAQTYFWYVDGQLVSTSETAQLAISKNSYEVALKVTSNIGCSDSTRRTFTFASSTSPRFEDLEVCAGSDFVLTPSGGSLFAFYRDAGLSNFIAKGVSLLVDSVTSDTTIYVVGLDEVLPSEPVAATIKAVTFSDYIVADPDKIYIDETKNASFWATNEATLRTWYLDGLLIGRLDTVRLFFPNTGDYEIRLTSQNALGCVSADTLLFEVLPSRPLGMDAPKKMSIFPNPTDGILHFHAMENIRSVSVLDLAGREVIHQESTADITSIDLGSLHNGVYLIVIRSAIETIQHRVILTH